MTDKTVWVDRVRDYFDPEYLGELRRQFDRLREVPVLDPNGDEVYFLFRIKAVVPDGSMARGMLDIHLNRKQVEALVTLLTPDCPAYISVGQSDHGQCERILDGHADQWGDTEDGKVRVEWTR